MVQWNKEKLVDLACHPDLTVPEIARRLGFSLTYIEKKLRQYRDEVITAQAAIQISDKMYCTILDLWEEGVPQPDIAASMNLSADVVRRIILISDIDEEPVTTGAAASLCALQDAHPDTLCMEDVRALTEYGAGRVPSRFLLASDVVMPLSEERARYKVTPVPPKRRHITLATSPMTF